MTHAEWQGEGQTAGRTAYLAELQCFLCGSLAGSIETDRKPLPPNGVWHPVGGGRAQRVADWRSLRCPRCGGALYAENVEAGDPPCGRGELPPERTPPRRPP